MNNFTTCMLLVIVVFGATIAEAEIPTSPTRYLGHQDYIELIKSLSERDFEKLDLFLSGWQERYESGRVTDEMVEHAYLSFANADPDLQPFLDEWVKVKPNSYSAWLAHGTYFWNLGQIARGNKYRDETPKVQLDRMDAFLKKARASLEKAIELNPKLSVAHARRLRVAMLNEGREVIDHLYEIAEQIVPASFVVRRAYLHSLQPKWGGGVSDMENFLNRTNRQLKNNPRLRVLRGYLPYVAADTLRDTEPNNARSYFDMAVKSGEFWFYYSERGLFLLDNNETEAALSDFNRSLTLKPQNSEVLVYRGRALYKLGHFREALSDYDLAVQLNRYDPFGLWYRSRALYKDGHAREAVIDLENTLRLGDGNPMWWWNIGIGVRDYLKAYKKSEKYLRKAVEMSPDTPVYWYDLALALHYQHDCQMRQPLVKFLELCRAGKTCDKERREWAEQTVPQLDAGPCGKKGAIH